MTTTPSTDARPSNTLTLVRYAAIALGTTGALAVWGAIDLAAYAYRIQRAARQLI